MDERSRMRLPDRIHTKIRVDGDNGCWEWTGRRDDDGYGRVHLGRHQLAHRVVWVLLVGDISDGPLDHLCCSPEWCSGGSTCAHRRCVNPSHLMPTTTRANVLRSNGITAQHAAADVCKRGHEFTPENTYRRPDGRTSRSCRTCQRLRESEYDRRQSRTSR